MTDLIVFLPCFNEEENITSLISSWISKSYALSIIGYKIKIYGIDDCSCDHTKEKIKEMADENDNVCLISHENNKGLSGGLNTAINTFLKIVDSGSFMVLMDGDNTHDPKYIFDMLTKINQGFDCVIASRYCDQSNVVGVSSIRKFLSDMARIFYKLLLRVPNVEDYTCGYRIYTYDIINKLVHKYGSHPVVEKSFACMMELLYKLFLSGARFSEVGFELRYDNKKGTSKMKIMKTMRKSIITAFRLNRHK